jgi:hypothetical protein
MPDPLWANQRDAVVRRDDGQADEQTPFFRSIETAQVDGDTEPLIRYIWHQVRDAIKQLEVRQAKKGRRSITLTAKPEQRRAMHRQDFLYSSIPVLTAWSGNRLSETRQQFPLAKALISHGREVGG